ncbi:protein TIFY 10a-like [Zingiber officinale]|uniref:protein TIFY 10a-like n=1 Tax=Zingiber officinale TaxID=94328 RepID=UPI001C4D4FCB|nr:protein TIFY 10a-like [Zingiber officinale]
MADAGRKRGPTNFAVACGLLSQYIKEKGSVADLGFGIARAAPEGKSESFRVPITMNLLPSADVLGGEESDKESEGEVVSDENPMGLFSQRSGFLTSASDDSRVTEQSQLTIFYGGKVLVFDNFPAEKAKDLMQLASLGNSDQNSTLVPKAATDPVLPQLNLSKLAQPNLSDLPIARKASLTRFLEKRKDRISARAPYRITTPSPQVATPMNQEDFKSWLGLGRHFIAPGLSLNSEYSR